MKINDSTAFLPQSSQEQARYVPSYMQNESQCQLCANDYDLNLRVPMMLCENQHNCCLECVNKIVVNKKQCPFCRKPINIDTIKKNRLISKMVESIANKKGITLKVNQHPQNNIKGKRKQIVIPPAAEAPRLAQNDIIAPLIPPMNNRNDGFYQPRLSCLQRLGLKNVLYIFTYVFVLIFCLPFAVCELHYGISLGWTECMDTDYDAGMTLRTWLLISGWIGAGMIGSVIIFVLFWNIIFGAKCKIVPQTVSVINLIVYLLKFLGWNIYGLVVAGNIPENTPCDDSLSSYMEALLIIECLVIIVLASGGKKGR